MSENDLNIEKKADRDEQGHFLEGHSVISPGRPKGRFSLTTQIINRLQENPDQTKEIIEWLLKEKRDLVWKMIDPEPPKDLNLGQNPQLPFIIKIMKDETSKNEETP